MKTYALACARSPVDGLKPLRNSQRLSTMSKIPASVPNDDRFTILSTSRKINHSAEANVGSRELWSKVSLMIGLFLLTAE